MSLEKRIKQEIAEVLGVNLSKIHDDARFIEDLGADSLNKTELMIALEANYNVKTSDMEADRIIFASDAIKFIEDRLSRKKIPREN